MYATSSLPVYPGDFYQRLKVHGMEGWRLSWDSEGQSSVSKDFGVWEDGGLSVAINLLDV